MKHNWKKSLSAVTLAGLLVVGAAAATVAKVQEEKKSTPGEEQAKESVLKDAGLSGADVTFKEVEPDQEGNKQVYDVEFVHQGKEYDYEVDAASGAVLEAEQDQDDRDDDRDDDREENSAEKVITAEQAKSLALKHAGLSGVKADFEKAELDRENGTLIYEVDFEYQGVEYDYELNAVTGAVLKAERDQDDDRDDDREDDQDDDREEDSAEKVITAEQAKSLALKHAGLSGVKADFEKAELDREDGAVRYEVEFEYQGVEYEYELDARTGAVVRCEKD